MSIFYIIADEKNKPVLSLIYEAAKRKQQKINVIDPSEFNFIDIPSLVSGDFLYRASIDPRARVIEKLLVNEKVSTLYTDYLSSIGRRDNVGGSSIIHTKFNLPIIPTIYSGSRDRKVLFDYAEQLGGFPVIVKILGGTRGVGIVKVDSLDALCSLMDYLMNNGERNFILRKYIAHSQQGRLVVLGEKVIASHANIESTDFRTNVDTDATRLRNSVTYDKDVQKVAVQATKVLGYDFGGVDILFEEDSGKFYIAEVNMPCNFANTQQVTGIEIAEAIIDYLHNKVQ